MRIPLSMPSDEELTQLSNDELNERIRMAFSQWNEMIKRSEDTTEIAQIFRAYDSERLKRLNRVKNYLK